MAAQEDSLLSPITAAADRSESTTLLVAKVSFCARDLHELGSLRPLPDSDSDRDSDQT
jgi:hypothetical protein